MYSSILVELKKIVLLAFVLVLLSIATSVCIVGFLGLRMTYALSYTNITVETAYNMITNGSYPGLVILDVRTQSEYDSGHIYGAVWIPHTELDARISELADHKNHEIVVYCLSGGRSATASGILDSYNFTKVYNMLGGISVWQSAGYPVWIAAVHNVNTTFNYDTIQAAIDAPQTLDGHTILVDAGIYYEHVVVNKSLSLIGENRSITIIDGGGSSSVVTVVANNVNITRLTIRNSGNFSEWPTACGVLVESNNNYLTRNVIVNNSYGIVLSTSNNNTLRENNMTGNILNFGVGWNPALGIFHFLHDIDESNSVDGSPIYYWINQHDKQIPTDAGSVYVINSTNIVAKNIVIVHDIVCFAGTSNSRIERVNSESGVVCLTSSQNNTILGNTIKGGQLSLIYSTNNTIVGNVMSDAKLGIYFFGPSHNNTIYHNNFVNNTKNVYLHAYNQRNFWDNGFEGNFWSNYTGMDSDHDGIDDTAHIIDANNTDNYPLMGMFSDFNATSEHHVQTICNSLISAFHFNGTAICFNVTGENDTTGFCRICIPRALMNETYKVFVNGTEVQCNLLPCSNITHSYLYFTYNHSTQEVVVIPEFPSWISMLLLLIVLAVSMVIYKRRLLKAPIH